LLKLKRVELHGFKSFFDRTELRFQGNGIAAVVGPNGCGKSNLSDAISWVLGEQSAKSLRGARMEDVIFAGTRDRKPLGMAAVTLTLTDPSAHGDSPILALANGVNGHSNGVAHHEPANGSGPHDVTITRRLFRSGDSEYLINGKLARLRDIQDLFLGTGLGPESYAIIEQGRIGQILSTKPSDRRAVIEEAAGITKFKTRKRLAEAKLEGAKQNLARVFDILEEVGRQVNSLKRQAAKAKRYGELREEMIAHLRRALSGRYHLLERDAAKTAIDLNLAAQELQKLTAAVAERETLYGAAQEQAYRTEAELTDARQRLSDLQLEQERTRGRLESQARQIGAIETRLTQDETESQTLEAQDVQLRQDAETHATALADLDARYEAARQEIADRNSEREQLQQKLNERSRLLDSGRQQVLRLLGQASSLKNQLAQVEEYLASLERDTARASREADSAAADLKRLDGVKSELSGQISTRQLELAATMDERRAVEQDLNQRRQSLNASRQELDRLRAEASTLKARGDSLAEIISHRSYTTESVKRLFRDIERGETTGLRPVGVLADFVEVEPGYEKATEEFLHEELEYVVVDDWGEARRGLDAMRSGQDGRATFLTHPPASTSSIVPDDDLSSEPGVTGRLGDRLRLTNGLASAPSDLLPRLAGCWLAADHESAQRLATEHPASWFLLPDGVSYHGFSVTGGKKTGAGPLALKRELRDVNAELRQKQSALETAQSAVASLDAQIATLAEQLERLRGLQQHKEKEAVALDQQFRNLGEDLKRVQSRLSVSRMELQRLEKEAQRSVEQRDRNRALLESAEQARTEQEQQIENARAEVEQLQAGMAVVAEQYSALRADLAGLEERRRAERSAHDRVQNQLRSVAQRRQDLGAEMERLGVERARLLTDNIELDSRAGELTTQLTAVEAELVQLTAAETELRASLAAMDEELKRLRAETQSAHERRSQYEVELVRKQSELKFLDETSRNELGVPISELASADETVPDDMLLAESEEKYRELRARIDALGPVNPEALEQYGEAQQRYEFLNAQRQDLLDSIRDTEKAIHEIDAESRKRFAEAFEAININFREMFTTLFGGGSGEMRLTDEENIAESGLDIVAQPPGKKLQNVLLLSGGEKSLTAMALLMAIFRYQPSPFCILDEVDAPLDEPNIERLTRLLTEMSGQTQFLVITHSRRTMEAAQALYGVTMQEPGVSRLVSVKFQTSAPAAPPAQLQMAVST
jgi:chromosome segregation protein